MTRDLDLAAVNRTHEVTIKKLFAENAMLRRALLDAADRLEKAGWRQSADLARDAAA